MEIDERLAKMAPHLFDNVEVERRKRELADQRRWDALIDELHGRPNGESDELKVNQHAFTAPN